MGAGYGIVRGLTQALIGGQEGDLEGKRVRAAKERQARLDALQESLVNSQVKNLLSEAANRRPPREPLVTDKRGVRVPDLVGVETGDLPVPRSPAPLVVPGSPEDLRIRKSQAAATASGTAGEKAPSDAEKRQAQVGANLASAHVTMAKLEREKRGAVDEAANAMTRPYWAKLIPGIGSKAEDMARQLRVAGLSGDAARYVATAAEFARQASQQGGAGSSRMPPNASIQQLYSEYAKLAGEPEGGVGQKQKNRLNVVETSKGQTRKELWLEALKARGVSESDLAELSQLSPTSEAGKAAARAALKAAGQ